MIKKIIKGLLLLIVSITIYMIFNNISFFKYIIYFIAFLAILDILGNDYEYYSRIIWLTLILISPYWGLMLYVTFGLTIKEKSVYKSKNKADSLFKEYCNKKESYDYDEYFNVLNNLGKQNIYKDSKVNIIKSGKEKYSLLFEKIKEAKEFIHLEYYIINDGVLFENLCDLLILKASEGVEVRILYDAFGSSISKKTKKHLLNNDIKLDSFGKFYYPLFNETFNFRNHRKIIIIDNKYAFTGGINIKDEYVIDPKNKKIEDTHAILEGNIVRELQLIFAKDWYYTTKENFIINNKNKYLKSYCIEDDSLTQIVSSGADNKEISIKDVYFKLITTAKKHVVIINPYFVPDYDILKAITTAAENGITVDLILPGLNDSILVRGVSRTYYQWLLDCGVNIYEVKNTFVHSKLLLIDDKVASVGTMNMDFRSFHLNFEVSVFSNSYDMINSINEIVLENIKDSVKINEENWKRRPIINRYCANIVQIFSPLL